MTQTITILASIKLAKGKGEIDLLNASDTFQKEFASQQPGIIRRELIRKGDGEYLDIIQFRSMKDVEEIMEKEKTSAVCHAFFSVMDLGAEVSEGSEELIIYQSLRTYS